MISYSLTCRAPGCGHVFDAWFKSSADYDRLSGMGLVTCPSCEGADVGKALMAPAVTRSKPGESGPQDLRQHLRALRRAVESQGEHVGPAFAEEARRIAEGRAPERFIYGDATDEEVRELREDGIAIGHLPWVPLEDA